MKKIEALTLELAYEEAASQFSCSVTELIVEVVQVHSKGFLGFFAKNAIIVVARKESSSAKAKADVKVKAKTPVPKKEEPKQSAILNDTIMPASFVSDQDEEDEELMSGMSFTADYDDEYDEVDEAEEVTASVDMQKIVAEVQVGINALFTHTCFNINAIEVSMYDDETLLVEFTGEDAALLIGKEGYRYKALSYMIFNWINSKYDVQLRLEIAEFLKNQEESIARYLGNVYENVERDGKAQTKILDGVLLQIALKELREKYPQKYVVIRSTRDGLKYIIVADYKH